MSWGSVSSTVLPLANAIIDASGQPDDYGQVGGRAGRKENLSLRQVLQSNVTSRRDGFGAPRQAAPCSPGGDFHDHEDFGPYFRGKTLRDHGNGAPVRAGEHAGPRHGRG